MTSASRYLLTRADPLDAAVCGRGGGYSINEVGRSMDEPKEKRPERGVFVGFIFGGASGIRTRGGLLTHTRFPGVRLKPLIHRSEASHCSRGRVHFGAIVLLMLETLGAPHEISLSHRHH